jgi:hypothetical protein
MTIKDVQNCNLFNSTFMKDNRKRKIMEICWKKFETGKRNVYKLEETNSYKIEIG